MSSSHRRRQQEHSQKEARWSNSEWSTSVSEIIAYAARGVQADAVVHLSNCGLSFLVGHCELLVTRQASAVSLWQCCPLALGPVQDAVTGGLCNFPNFSMRFR